MNLTTDIVAQSDSGEVLIMLAKQARVHRPQAEAGHARGFTLIELLVVVSIIALLISILLPSLKSAREQAKTVTCLATQRGLVSTNAVYHSQYNDWLAGAPGTSGSALLRHPDRSSWGPSDTQLAVSAGAPAATMLQMWDWITPLEMFESLPDNRPDYYKLAFAQTRCANNNLVASPVVGAGVAVGSPWRATQAPSYYTIRNFLVWPNDSGTVPYAQATAQGAGIGGEGGAWVLPKGYGPRLERIGNPAQKVFITDASRYTKVAPLSFTFNIEWNGSAGGAFSTAGAAVHYADGDGDDNYLHDFFFTADPVTRPAAPLTYRHRKGTKVGVVACFFDGHGAYVAESESRHSDFWWPKGTHVNITAELNEPAKKLVRKQVELSGPYKGYYKVR